jgi:hypothetical protein
MVENRKHFSAETYEKHCSSFNLPPLKTLRDESDVVFLFKSLNSMVDSELFIERLAFNDIERSTRNLEFLIHQERRQIWD